MALQNLPRKSGEGDREAVEAALPAQGAQTNAPSVTFGDTSPASGGGIWSGRRLDHLLTGAAGGGLPGVTPAGGGGGVVSKLTVGAVCAWVVAENSTIGLELE